MTLEQLRIFVTVAEREHLTRAAGELHLTQSAVSAAIAALEHRHATRLFDRVGRRIVLTEAGRLFLVEARGVLARARAAEAVLSDLAGLKRGSLTLAASQTIGNYWLPPLLHRYRVAHPGITVHATIGNTETVAAAVRDGSADLGFVEGAVDDPALEATPVADDVLALVVGPALWTTRTRRVTTAKLKALPWVFRERGSGTRAIFDAVLAKQGIAPADLNVVLELPTNEAVRAAVLDGAGAAVLSRLAVTLALKAGSLVALDYPLPKRHFVVLRHKEHHGAPAERAFCELLGIRKMR